MESICARTLGGAFGVLVSRDDALFMTCTQKVFVDAYVKATQNIQGILKILIHLKIGQPTRLGMQPQGTDTL